MRCDEVALALPGIMGGVAFADGPMVGHVETCLRCQAELSRYRALLRMLDQLRVSEIDPPPGLLADLLGALEAAAKRRAVRSALTGRRIAYGSGIAGTVGIAALVVLAARARAGRHGGLARRTRSEQGAMV